MSIGCASMFSQDNTPINYCPAIERLLSEHVLLREQMAHYYKLATELKNADEALDKLVQGLHEVLVTFVGDLDPHSQREEDTLFPAIGKYIGHTSGPLVVMEYEHDQAKKNLALFMETYEKSESPMTKEIADELANYAIEAYLILTDHFMKEENVLFPMAEKFLTGEEKNELVIKFEEIK